MNNSTPQTSPGPGQPGSQAVSDVVIRIAGNSQDGIQAIGGFLARLAGRSEQEVMTFMTIPSTISGGPSIFQVRISSGEVLSAGDEADVLVAFYQHSYDDHLHALKKGGIVLYDTEHVIPKTETELQYHHVGVPISALTVEAIGGTGKDKGKNLFVLGLLAKMYDLNVLKLTALITERFGGRDHGVLENAVGAFNAGYGHSFENMVETFRFLESEQRDKRQVVMNGNEAIALGLIAAGVRFGAAYPITPWSDVMELLRRELPKYGGTFVQCEDEIAAISMALGSSYTGRVAVTGSSGPGLSLKMEALGWGIMAEVPLVIVDVQRGGPSTGLPTNVEQSDLNLAVFGSHGDAPRIVIAPSNVEDAFYSAIEAVNLARDYSCPVIMLTDQSIATRIEAFEEPNLEKVCQDLTPALEPVASCKPYDLSSPNGVAQHRPPGTWIQDGRYPVASGLEHDEYGHPSGSPRYHTEMTAKRRQKLQALADKLPIPAVYGAPEGEVLLVGWGSSRGILQEAVERARAAGDAWSALAMRHINPLPQGLDRIFQGFKHVMVVELNDQGIYGYGQLAGLLRARYCDSRIQGINKTEGLTFKVREVLEQVRARVSPNQVTTQI
jgi:2-oxoglutarate/2-oxoacid ferredoxin oxidoreductase subunit alpha